MTQKNLPDQIGSYQIVDILGQGGMGVVYRGIHQKTRQFAAIKTVRLLQQGQMISIRREIHALAAIRHPGIVRIFDTGYQNGIPWYAMELLDCPTLKKYTYEAFPETAVTRSSAENEAVSLQSTVQLDTVHQPQKITSTEDKLNIKNNFISDSPMPKPLPPDVHTIIKLARRTCAPLAYLHGEGIVHRDLKPDNIFIRPGESPVIVDFGLVSRFSADSNREVLEMGGTTAGTVAYMSPEQIRGEYVDARADIYSFGCILYELLTGVKPFLGDTVLEILKAHLENQPIPPSQINPHIPKEIEDLIQTMMAKKRRNRIGYMEDIERIMKPFDPDTGSVNPEIKPKPYLYRPGLAGRSKEFALVQKWLTDLENRKSRAVYIEGESGVGKTRFALEMIRESKKHDFTVIATECHPVAGMTDTGEDTGSGFFLPFKKILQHLTDYCRESGYGVTSRIFGTDIKLLAELEPVLLTLPRCADLPEPVELPGTESKHRLFNYFSSVLQTYAQINPLVLLLDDLQWADSLSLDFLKFFIRHKLPDYAHILIICLSRPETPDFQPAEIFTGDFAETVRLTRLDNAAVDRMISDMIAVKPPPSKLTRFLQEFSEGNPFFVAEFMLSSIHSGVLYRDDAGRWNILPQAEATDAEIVFEKQPLPPGLRNMILGRMIRLPDKARQLLEVFSIVGRETEHDFLKLVSGMDDGIYYSAVHELIRRQLIEESINGSIRFIHHKIRDLQYSRIDAKRLVLIHHSTAKAMESYYADRLRDHSMALGIHWEKSGHPEQAMKYYRIAARDAVKNYAHRDAVRIYNALLRLVPKPSADSVQLKIEMAYDVDAFLSRSRHAEKLLIEALEEARCLKNTLAEAQSLRILASIYAEDMGKFKDARLMYEQALEIYRNLNLPKKVGEILGNLATVASSEGRPDDAVDYCCKALELHRESGLELQQGQIIYQYAIILQMQGRSDESLARFEEALSVFRKCNNRRYEALALGMMSPIYAEKELFEKAMELCWMSLQIARLIKDRKQEAQRMSDMGDLHESLQQPREARSYYQQAITLFRELGSRRPEGICLASCASIALHQNRLDEALEYSKSALKLFKEIHDLRCESMALSDLAKIYIASGNATEARDVLIHAIRITEEIHNEIMLPEMLCDLAFLKRVVFNEVQEAEQLANRAIRLCRQHRNIPWLILALCEYTHTLLAQGKNHTAIVEEITKTSPLLIGKRDSRITSALEKIDRALELTGKNHPLNCGMHPDDIPRNLRN